MFKVTVDVLKEQLLNLYTRLTPREAPAIFLHGSPGVGKSEGIAQLAKELGQIKGKRIHVTDVRLLLFNTVDLRGIPVADVNKEFAIWLKPYIFNMDPSEDTINFLVLDELTSAPPSVQACAYQITLDRRIGEHEFPDNLIVIAAGNKVTDRGIVNKIAKPLANRMIHLEVITKIPVWKKWAIPAGIDMRVIGYMNYKNADSTLFDFDPTSDDMAFRTPRSWAMVSRIIQGIDTVQDIHPLIAGTIGDGPAVEFIAYCRLYESLPDIERIFQGGYKDVPRSPDILYALSGAILGRAKDRTQDEINNLVEYLEIMPAEIAYLTTADCILDPDIRMKIGLSPGFKTFIMPKWGQMLFDRR